MGDTEKSSNGEQRGVLETGCTSFPTINSADKATGGSDKVVDRRSSEANSSSASTLTDKMLAPKARSIWRRTLDILTYTPKYLRHDPDKPLRYSLSLTLVFGMAGMATVANLYYSYPILNILAEEFGVPEEKSAMIPTLAQVGYCVGLLFINPMADFVKRRPFCLGLMTFTTVVWIGLCITEKFEVFAALTFLTSLTTVTPQIMLPLVADLAPPERRATAVSIVTSGLLLGLLFARLMSGVVTNFILWRYVYWIALALQGTFTVLLWFCMPDYPRTNAHFNYFSALKSIAVLLWRSPILQQASLMGFCTAACFTSFWTTLTFLLSAPPYDYHPLFIGLFSLIGIVTMTVGPPFSRYVIDRYVTAVGAISGTFVGLVTIIVGTYIGTFTVAGPIIQAIGVDLGFQITQIANRTAIYGIDPKARNRVNTAYMVALFCGQLTGTSSSSSLYAEGGWHRSGAASIGFMAAAFLLNFIRGPRESRLVGWRGGWNLRRTDLPAGNQQPQDQEQQGTAQERQHDGEKDRDVEATVVDNNEEPPTPKEADTPVQASAQSQKEQQSDEINYQARESTERQREAEAQASRKSLERCNRIAQAWGAPPRVR